MNTLCFSSFVFGDYQKYIPYYIYSIWKNYPETNIKIFIEDRLQEDIKVALNLFKNSDVNFEIVELQTSFENYENFKMKGSGAKTMIRWLMGYEYYSSFKYVYIGDIDMLFMPEDTSVLDFHINQMKQLKVPFSNKVRLDAEGKLTTRLTGLHFIETKPYFDKIQPIISKIKTDIPFRNTYLEGLERNENFLYKINKEAFGFNPILLSQALQPFHGLHLGISRWNFGVDRFTILDNSSLGFKETKGILKGYLRDPLFTEIQKRVFLIELEVILRKLSLKYPFSWRLKALRFRFRNKKKRVKKSIKKFLKLAI